MLYLNLRELKRSQYESVVCHLRDQAREWRAPIEALGCPVESLGLRSPYDIVRAVASLCWLVRRRRIDLLHTHLYFPNLYGQIAARLTGVPVVSSIHNLEYEPEILLDNPRLTPIKQRALRLGSRLAVRLGRPVLIAVSEAVRASCIRHLGVHDAAIVTIRNGVDVDDFSIGDHRGTGLRQRLGIGAGEPMVLTVGRLVPLKGHRYLLEALPEIRRAFPAVRLVFVGLGPLADELSRLAAGLGVRQAVHFVGGQADVREYVLACDLVAAPSLSEGFGLVLAEAMAMGRACVASRTGGIPEIVEDGRSGLLVPPGDAGGLATAVIRLLTNPEMRREFGRRGREIVGARFDSRDAARRLERLYDTLLEDQHSRRQPRRRAVDVGEESFERPRAPSRGRGSKDTMSARETVYITYDGLLEPLGQSQVVSYVIGLARRFRMTLISYEKRTDLVDRPRVAALEQRLRAAGVRWIPLRYHKRPTLPATMFDVLVGAIVALRVTLSRSVWLVHARGYVPSIIAVWLKRLRGVKFLFDMRGFWADEKVDANHWVRRSIKYRLAKRWERVFFEEADAIVSLTEEGMRVFPELGYRISRHSPVEVIPTCADLSRFVPGPRDPALASRLGLEHWIVAGCVGTLSNWYLREETLEYLAFLVARIPNLKVLFVTREDHPRLQEDALRAGIPAKRMVLTRADFAAMPDYVRLMDLGVFFIRACFSKKGSAATKLAEFLGTGVPVVINDGVGDSGRIVRDHDAGVVLSEARRAAFASSMQDVERLLGDAAVSARCVAVARKYFDLEQGIAKYMALYDQMVFKRGA